MTVNHGPDSYRGWFESSRWLSGEERVKRLRMQPFLFSPHTRATREKRGVTQIDLYLFSDAGIDSK